MLHSGTLVLVRITSAQKGRVDCRRLSSTVVDRRPSTEIDTFLLGRYSENGVRSHRFSKMLESIIEAIKNALSSSMSQVLITPRPWALFF
jgi:hypothetical protein